MGGGARIYSSFSEIKLPDPSSCSIFVGENKCLDQGTVLLHGEENEAGENIPFCAPIVSRSNRKGADYRFLAGGGRGKKILVARKARKNNFSLQYKIFITEGGKHLLPSFIMIGISVLFWHCIFRKH